ncbi:MAG: hypothetical protein IIB08_03740, partial [Bacteroidetes bacterium]|nr:hypothetical protein [Bacteroidota bacterium]
MKKPDFISIFIAVLISTFIFLFHEMRLKEMKKSDNNLGDISVNSITIEKGGGLYIRDLNGTRRFLIDLKDNEITMGLIDKEGSLFFNVGEQAKTRGFFLLDKTSDAGLMCSTLEDGGAAFSL